MAVFYHTRLGWGILDQEGNWGPLYWSWYWMVGCNCLVPQIFWFKKCRTSIPIMLVASVLVNVGMWFERFVIIVASLYRDFLPSSWGDYTASPVDMCLYLGTFGLFLTLFLLFVRWIPMFAMAELKAILPHAHPDPENLEEESPADVPITAAVAEGGVLMTEPHENQYTLKQ